MSCGALGRVAFESLGSEVENQDFRGLFLLTRFPVHLNA